MKDYFINIFYSDEDAGYIADIPDLRNCSAFGSTPKQALNEVLKVKAAWIEAAKAAGKPIPQPSFRPAIYQAIKVAAKPEFDRLIDQSRRQAREASMRKSDIGAAVKQARRRK